MFQKTLIILFILPVLLSIDLCFAGYTNIGFPPTYNYSKKKYNASPQNWDIAEDKDGIMYFGNNNGMLVFDGHFWNCYNVTNNTIVRSIKISDDQRIYVGAQGEFGYFLPDKKEYLKYYSLKNLLSEEDQNFADIWEIAFLNESVFFRTNNAVYQYNGKKISIIYRGNALSYLANINGSIFFHDINKGLFKFEEDSISLLTGPNIFKFEEISGMLSLNSKETLIFTLRNGIFIHDGNIAVPWNTKPENALFENTIYCLTSIDNRQFAIGTSSEGVFVFDTTGKLLKHIDQDKGLQTNNILSLYCDRSKNLWVGSNNGIDLIDISSPFSFIYTSENIQSTGYAVQIHNNKLYLGTSNGLYVNDWKSYYDPSIKDPFQLVSKTGGQVWDLLVFDDDLFLNHHEGIFIVDGNTRKKVDAKNGAWLQIEIGNKQLLSGHYEGLTILEKDKQWNQKKDFTNKWNESCRFLVKDKHNNIWSSHPYRGIFKIEFNNDFSELLRVKNYNTKNGLPTDLLNHVYSVNEEAVICAEKGIYHFNNETDRFEPSEKWNKIFDKNIRVKKLIQVNSNTLWFVTDKEVGYITTKGENFFEENEKFVFPQLNEILVNSFEEIYFYDNENVFIAHETGFIHFNPEQTKVDTTFDVLIRKVHCKLNDSLIFNGISSPEKLIPEISFNNNTVQFFFSATSYTDSENNKFQYMLEGFDKNWSDLTKSTNTEYTNLNEGNYTFKVIAKNSLNKLSSIKEFKFKVLPPWYRSIIAFLSYMFILSLILFAIVFVPRQRYQKEKTALHTEYQFQEKIQKDQITKLEREKLELQINAKDQENLKLKEEKLKAELSLLKEQISPHFFFNTLNALSSIIRREDKENSLDFVENISDVYRYLLDSESKDMVKIDEELMFLDAYMKLLSKRFGQNLKLNIKIDDACRSKKIPVMALQILIENVVKHNKIGKKESIKVQILNENNYLIIKNNINKKNVSDSHGLGLANLKKRYKILTNLEPEIIEDKSAFKVKLPIL